jgi:flagellar biosynthesis GTPase FlhF
MSTPGELLEALGREARARLGNGQNAAAEELGVRVYRGRSVEEIVPRIEQELGGEAIIVRRREGLTGGVLGFFQRPFVEIEAMPGTPRVDVYDDEDEAAPDGPVPSLPPGPDAPVQQAAEPPRGATAPPLAQEPPRPSAPPYPPTAAPPARAPAAGPAPGPPVPAPWEAVPGGSQPPAAPPPLAAQAHAEPGGSVYVTAQLAALARAERSTLARRDAPAPVAPRQDLAELLAREPPRMAGSARAAAGRAPSREQRTVAPGSHLRARAGVERSLRRVGVSEELARELIEAACAHALPLAPRAGLAHAVRATLAQRIPVAPPLPLKGAAVVVVGAGGAGKTTCCSALLSAYRDNSSLPASYATLMRAGAGDIEMILSPALVRPAGASTPRALRALARARADGLAIVDTPRVSPADRGGVRELARVLAQLKPDRVLVALPATLGAAAAAQLVRSLEPLGADALAVTHAEETDQIGVAVETACRFGLAPEYMLDRRNRGGGWRLRGLDAAELTGRLLP